MDIIINESNGMLSLKEVDVGTRPASNSFIKKMDVNMKEKMSLKKNSTDVCEIKKELERLKKFIYNNEPFLDYEVLADLFLQHAELEIRYNHLISKIMDN